MRRRVIAIVIGVAAIGALAGCRREPTKPPGTAAATTRLHEWSDADMRSLLRGFLAALPDDWHTVRPADLAGSRPFVVDVREPDEYAAGFIAGAVNIPLRSLANQLEALPPTDADVVVACASGHRSAVAMAVLQMLGYARARSLEGGVRGWGAAGLPLVTAPVPVRRIGPTPSVNPQLRAALEYYLVHTLPVDWGAMTPAALTEDQHRKSSAELEAQPETFDQGRSLLVDVDGSQDFASAALSKAINAPLRELPDRLDHMPLQETVNWA